VRGQDEISTKADVVASVADGLFDSVQTSGEGLAIIRVTENDNGLDSLLIRRRELGSSEVNELASLTNIRVRFMRYVGSQRMMFARTCNPT
jgi:hypothetical protein